MSLGETISTLRGEKRLSQGELADRLEVSRQSVSKWETDASVPDLDKLVKLSQVFGVTLDELVKGEAPQPAAEVVAQSADPVQPAHTNFPPRKIAGCILFGMAVFVVLLCTVMGGLLEGLILSSPFLVCGTLCFACPRHPGLWCAWAVYLMVDLYFRFATGITWRMIAMTPIFTPQMNYLRLAFAWGQFAGLVILVLVTVFRLGKQPIQLTKRDGGLLVGTLALWLAMEFWGWGRVYALLGQTLLGMEIMWLVMAVLDLLRTTLLVAILTVGLRALRGRKQAKAEARE